MPGPFWPLVVLAELSAGAGVGAPANLDVAALSSPRPQACRGAQTRAASGVWARVRGAERERYCDLLARGYARLAGSPEQALKAAEAARQIAGETSAVLVLEGRAAARLGDAARARAAFARAASDASAFLDLGALRDYARVSSLAGDAPRAAALYRTLASRAGLLDGLARSVVYIEAAAHVLAADRASTEEALAYLGQADAGRSGQGLSDLLLVLSALCLDRAEHTDRARLLLAGRTFELEPEPRAAEDVPLLPPGELGALRALALEAADPVRARQAWDDFIAHAPAGSPWLEHARKKRDRLALARKVRP